jgi:hypothetical protein
VKEIIRNTNENSVFAVFHIRVGNLVLETSSTYWKNLISLARDIADFEFGLNSTLNVFFTYVQTEHRFGAGRRTRKRLEKSTEQWDSHLHTLHPSHLFISEVCNVSKFTLCFWKSGCKLAETIDMYMTFDIVHLSGSSLSRTLGMFSSGMKIVGLSKDADENMTYLMQQVTSFSNTAYYYVDSNGNLYNEQLVFKNG